MNKFVLVFTACLTLTGSVSASAAQSLFQWDRKIYCVNNDFIPHYHVLKEVAGYIHTGFFRHSGYEAIAVDETCASLVQQCQAQFGAEFGYVQSGQSFVNNWDTVKDVDGIICQHRFADPH